MLRVEDLPAEAMPIVRDYVASHPEYETPAAARGSCCFASLALAERLTAHDLDAWEISYDVLLADGDDPQELPVVFMCADCEEMDLPTADVMRYYASAYDCAVAFEAHTILRLDCDGAHWYIDLTAKQMHPDAPYPLIWVVRGDP